MVNWKQVDTLARAQRQVDPTANEETLRRQLEIWFCLQYNLPFKSEILTLYNIDELVFEYLIHYYLKPENDPRTVNERKKQEEADEEWIKKSLAGIKQQKANKNKDSEIPPEPIKPEQNIPTPPDISTQFES
jgi:hypothetical protein